MIVQIGNGNRGLLNQDHIKSNEAESEAKGHIPDAISLML